MGEMSCLCWGPSQEYGEEGGQCEVSCVYSLEWGCNSVNS